MFPIIPQYLVNKVTISESDASYIPFISPAQIPKPGIVTATNAITTNKHKVTVTAIIEKNYVSSKITASEIIDEENMEVADQVSEKTIFEWSNCTYNFQRFQQYWRPQITEGS